MNNNLYTFQKSRTGEIVPVIMHPREQPLHSMIDPVREGERLVSEVKRDDFIIFLGLGGGFAPKAILEATDTDVLIIDYKADELFSNLDYTLLLNNERFYFLLDPNSSQIIKFITEHYKPALCGGIKVIPLRTRIEGEKERFESAASSIREAIEIVSADYSVQAHFGKRWFSNIIRNVSNIEFNGNNFFKEGRKPVNEAAIVAAGPSLDIQLESLANLKSRGGFIICADTALPVLLQNRIEPDVVVSIDCQHISYFHFIGGVFNVPIVLDIASPPLLSGLGSPVFFSSSHPLARYVSKHLHLPHLDTSGGNVTYACLSFAEFIQAKKIVLYGTDFSYVNSKTYAKGTYIYPFFERKQTRIVSLEAQLSKFLYRNPFLPKECENQTYIETSQMRFYRKKFEEKASGLKAGDIQVEITCEKGNGAPITIDNNHKQTLTEETYNHENFKKMSGKEFLKQYKKDITSLPKAAANENYLKKLTENEKIIFFTLLPYAAAFKKRNSEIKQNELIEEVKNKSIKEIENLLKISNCSITHK